MEDTTNIPNEEQTGRLQQAAVMQWVAPSESLPPIDEADDWNKRNRVSVRVMCYSKRWGMRFGSYYYAAGFWVVDHVTSSNGVEVEWWCIIRPPVA